MSKYDYVLEQGKTNLSFDMKRVFSFQKGRIEVPKKTVTMPNGEVHPMAFFGVPSLSLVKPKASLQ